MNDTCDCCEGTEQLTPKRSANRPGLNALAYHVGTHATFLETMKARLSNYFLDIPQERENEQGQPWAERIYPLSDLTTRAAGDPSIALLDAWATVGGVLTFYQERIANEGYLRTATERRSILELARLVGYALRPGVASTVYLAYTIDSNFKEEVIIPAGARNQSVPGPDELPQSFETSEKLEARAAWNNLEPRLSRPQTESSIKNGDEKVTGPRVYLKGTSTNLDPNDVLLIKFSEGAKPAPYRVMTVEPAAKADHTLVTLQELPTGNQTLSTRAAHAEKQGSRKAKLTPLNEYVADFSSAASLDITELPALVIEFADDLLKTFAALAEAPASPDRNEAINDTLTDLKRLRDLLKQIPEIN